MMPTSTTNNDPLFSNIEAAEYIGVKPSSLEVWRCTKRYAIPYIKCGRLVRYRRSDLEQWLESRTISCEAITT